MSVAVIHTIAKVTWGERGLPDVTGQSLIDGPEAETAAEPMGEHHSLTCLLSVLSNTFQDHLPRISIVPSELSPLIAVINQQDVIQTSTGQSHGDIFLDKVSSSKMIVAPVK